MCANILKSAARKLGYQVGRIAPSPYPLDCVSLASKVQPSRGRCLIAYIVAPFLENDAGSNASHTHFSESILMAECWLELGFDVDVIDYRNAGFIPQVHYDYFVSARKHLATIAERLHPNCVKIAHLDVTHFVTNNIKALERLLVFQQRHKTSVPSSIRLMESNRGIDAADFGMVLGNSTTKSSYMYSGKPLYCLNVPTVYPYEWDEEKLFSECKDTYLWLGSSGLLHKGLDLALDAFLGMPDKKLIVCGPLEEESDFVDCYSQEIAASSNVELHGWVDVGSADFLEICRRCAGIVYPSCGEGQAGSVVTAIRAGLIPIVSKETGLDVHEAGIVLEDNSVSSIRNAVNEISGLSADELQRKARASWESGNAKHSKSAYLESYAKIIDNIVTS